MTILDQIIDYKREEVVQRRAAVPLEKLKAEESYGRPCYSLSEALLREGSTGIIAEFKRKSPSKGLINGTADVEAVTGAYYKHGAAALSVLTDGPSFGGSSADLRAARKWPIPLLRKDFMVDSYQLHEAKAMGADVILLIAACLSPSEVNELAHEATSLGLDVLLELHAEEELEHISKYTKLIGINNRNLKTFEVDIERSMRMAAALPQEKIKVAESGISSVDTITLFRNAGFRGFLIGENFMKQADPAIAFAGFVEQLNTKA